jgi:hypothetical protein
VDGAVGEADHQQDEDGREEEDLGGDQVPVEGLIEDQEDQVDTVADGEEGDEVAERGPGALVPELVDQPPRPKVGEDQQQEAQGDEQRRDLEHQALLPPGGSRSAVGRPVEGPDDNMINYSLIRRSDAAMKDS